jgi:hypothetical protein
MAANYLAVYYLKGHHKNILTTPPPLRAYIHTYMPKAGGKLHLIDQLLGGAQGQH